MHALFAIYIFFIASVIIFCPLYLYAIGDNLQSVIIIFQIQYFAMRVSKTILGQNQLTHRFHDIQISIETNLYCIEDTIRLTRNFNL